ncbi:MAG: hypothetical protein EB084_24480 [Proteobacteria bacterium]|nr:hypothetical protein [Pseudomonadota bacterium]
MSTRRASKPSAVSACIRSSSSIDDVRSRHRRTLVSLGRYRRLSDFVAASLSFLRDDYLLRANLTLDGLRDRAAGLWQGTPVISVLHAHLNRLHRDHPACGLRLVTSAPSAELVHLANLWITQRTTLAFGAGGGGLKSMADHLDGARSRFATEIADCATATEALDRAFAVIDGKGVEPSGASAASVGVAAEFAGGAAESVGGAAASVGGAAASVGEAAESVGGAAASVGESSSEARGVGATPRVAGSGVVVCAVDVTRGEGDFLAGTAPRMRGNGGVVLPILLRQGRVSGGSGYASMDDEDLMQALTAEGFDARLVDIGLQFEARLYTTLEWALHALLGDVTELSAGQGSQAGEGSGAAHPLIVLSVPRSLAMPPAVSSALDREREGLADLLRADPALFEVFRGWIEAYVPYDLVQIDGVPDKDLLDLLPGGAERGA